MHVHEPSIFIDPQVSSRFSATLLFVGKVKKQAPFRRLTTISKFFNHSNRLFEVPQHIKYCFISYSLSNTHKDQTLRKKNYANYCCKFHQVSVRLTKFVINITTTFSGGKKYQEILKPNEVLCIPTRIL